MLIDLQDSKPLNEVSRDIWAEANFLEGTASEVESNSADEVPEKWIASTRYAAEISKSQEVCEKFTEYYKYLSAWGVKEMAAPAISKSSDPNFNSDAKFSYKKVHRE